MSFLIWLAGVVLIYCFLKLFNKRGNGDAVMAYAILYLGGWSVICFFVGYWFFDPSRSWYPRHQVLLSVLP